MRSGTGWQFDIAAGAHEIVNRRIGENELDAIAMLHGFVEAQLVYATESRDGSGVRGFARKLLSAPGQKDGLYWVADNSKGEPSSPFTAMIGEPGTGDVPMLRNGYRYRILTAQGAGAPGGAYSYVINGRLLAGFALIAYPAAYGNTGVMTFIVNHYGDVYEKNFGPDTATIAARIAAYSRTRVGAGSKTDEVTREGAGVYPPDLFRLVGWRMAARPARWFPLSRQRPWLPPHSNSFARHP